MSEPRRPFAARWHRLAEVGVAGLARRARDRVGGRARERAQQRWRQRFADLDPRDLLDQALGTRASDAAIEHTLAPARTPFFFDGCDGALARAFAARHGAALEAIVAEAEATLAGDWSWIAPGGRADWHAALPGSARWPLDDPQIGAASPLGDVRLNWELTRGTQLVRLAQAAWATRDARFAAGAVALLDDFARHNPPGRGVAWLHAQETALRGVALLWTFHLLRGAEAFDAAARRRWLALLLCHVEYTAAHLADHPITHNHLVSEAAGLALVGMALPALVPAARWRRRGARLLWRELAKQVDDEGVHGEHSSHYHGFVLDSALAVLLLGERAGSPAPPRAHACVAAMADVVAWLLGPDGRLPAIGDTDAGRALRLGGDPLDRRDTLAAAAVAFDRAEWGAIAGDAPGAFWLTGGRPVPGAGATPPGPRARRFVASGLGIARTGYGSDDEVLVFRVGPTRFRADVQRSHMHADALSVIWRCGAQEVLIDPGTYLYSEAAGWRALLRGTASHSCVTIDDRDQADVRSMRFGISGEAPARWLGFEAGTNCLEASAEHPAGALPCVRRRVEWRPGALLLHDDVLGEGEHEIALSLPLPRVHARIDGLRAEIGLPDGRLLSVEAGGDAADLALVTPGDPAIPGPGWFAPRYGTLVGGCALRIRTARRALPLRLVTHLRVARASS